MTSELYALPGHRDHGPFRRRVPCPTLAGRRETLRNIIAGVVVLLALVLMCLLIKPVMVDGQVITYWMGNWER
ncbi:MAG: hypothetical protein V8S87_10500 [Oscillospiraceae bacterium]